MIVPMKKVSLIVLDSEKEQALIALRKLGLVQIEISQGSGARLAELKEQVAELENSIFAASPKKKKNLKKIHQQDASVEETLEVSSKIAAATEEKKECYAEIAACKSELERLKAWGQIDPKELAALAEKGVSVALCEIPQAEYAKLDDEVKLLVLGKTKTAVRVLVVNADAHEELEKYRVQLPQMSTSELSERIAEKQARIQAIDEQVSKYAKYVAGMKSTIASLQKDIELETYATGMVKEELTDGESEALAVAYFHGYIPTEDLDKLKKAVEENAWGLVTDDPTEDDNVPTKLKNNKFVSLIYPLTDFLGTVPGYFEYDISSWFLGFILIFFGIIFGDGGYGLLICGVAAAMMIKAKKDKKRIAPMHWLILLLGGATVLWGLLTCTWFGLTPEQLPEWLRNLSLPIFSNVNAAKLWYPPWTNGAAGLTTAQNLQIFCFVLALVQMSVAHIKGMVRYRKSLKMIGELGSLLQLVGMFYVVLALVVNAEVFSLGLVLGGIPVGTVAIGLVGVGFVMSFVFANYEGSIVKSILESLKNIISVLLGVVNVFSDIISYIRLWAVGLAGAAISATVNEFASPMLGNLMMIVFVVILLVFGHGLNMILNLLSVIVHGVRLNTLEFSTHLGMTWSGHKFKPFEE